MEKGRRGSTPGERCTVRHFSKQSMKIILRATKETVATTLLAFHGNYFNIAFYLECSGGSKIQQLRIDKKVPNSATESTTPIVFI